MSVDASVATLTLVAGFGAAMVAGVFFAFSTFVMAGLGEVEAEHGMRAMQGINEAAVAAPLMILMFGTAIVAMVLGAITLISEEPMAARSSMLVGLGIYFIGVVVVTAIANVPMNNTLAGMNPMESSGQAYWATYLSRWTLINHIRTVTSAIAAVAFFVTYLKN